MCWPKYDTLNKDCRACLSQPLSCAPVTWTRRQKTGTQHDCWAFVVLEMRLNIYSHFSQVAEFRQLSVLKIYSEFSNMTSDKGKKRHFYSINLFYSELNQFLSYKCIWNNMASWGVQLFTLIKKYQVLYNHQFYSIPNWQNSEVFCFLNCLAWSSTRDNKHITEIIFLVSNQPSYPIIIFYFMKM